MYGLIAVVISSRSARPLLGATVVVVPVSVLFLLIVPISDLVQQLVWYPLVGPREFRGLAGPSLSSILDPNQVLAWLLYWPPLVIIGLAIVKVWRTRTLPAPYGALLILAILCRLQTLGRADEIHTAESMVPAVLLLAYVLPRPQRSIERVGLAVGAAVVMALAALPLTMVAAPGNPYDQALDAAVSVVRANTQPDEPIFVGEIQNLHTLRESADRVLPGRPPAGGAGHDVQPRGHEHRGHANADGGRSRIEPRPVPHLGCRVCILLRAVQREPNRRPADPRSGDRRELLCRCGLWSRRRDGAPWERRTSCEPGHLGRSKASQRGTARLRDGGGPMNDLDIVVLGGAGHVGLPFSLVAAEAGLRVGIFDTNSALSARSLPARCPF